jgi:hypothetical protein
MCGITRLAVSGNIVPTPAKTSTREIRELHIPGDFQNWKHPAAFEAAFAILLSDLRAGIL